QYTDATARRLGMLKLGAAIKANMQADDSVIDNEVLYYTNSIGFLEVDSLSDLCKYTNTKKENFKIAYPSNAYVDGIPSAVNEKPYYHFADRFGLSRCYLHDTVPSPFSRSKFIVCRGKQDGRPASSPITLLYLGSHRLAAKSLGTVSHGGSVIKLESYDMGLLVCSWTTEEGVCHVPDMSTLGIPVDVNKLHKYAADDIPYIPSAYNHLKVHRAVGKLVRAVPKKSFGFLSKLLPADPLYDCIEPEKLKFPEKELFIHLDTIKDSGFSNQLVAGSIFDVFYAKLKTHTNKRESNPRAFYVLNIIRTLKNVFREGDAKKEKPSPLFEENTGRMLAEMFGSDDCTPPDGSSAKKISIQRHLTLDPEKSFEENMVVLGLNSDEEIDEYMRTNWFSGALAVKRGKRQQMMCSIEPDPCLSLNRFMERYITWRYGKNWHPYAFGPCSYHNVLRSFRCVV
ncbi:uncharacterized protein LOC106158153, partial [Lingula anatina]|uniref:Uncharacterized protein LOC106158153 n=1 Tax=Lingula anatina TaxID=7574 RepID=A0A1S3HTY0_LINAN